ncbi:malectin [Arsenicicoccus dermatophilus]|nr:malectin [Arsenicicoccus dermatophilus]
MASVDVAGTQDDALYRITAYNFTSYRRNLPNGTYTVKLYTAEDYHTAPGKRVFDITAEGRTVAANVDVFARTGGRYRAFEPTFTVTVTDGRLDLGFPRKVDSPLLAAVEVLSAPSATTSLTTTTNTGTRATTPIAPRTR